LWLSIPQPKGWGYSYFLSLTAMVSPPTTQKQRNGRFNSQMQQTID